METSYLETQRPNTDYGGSLIYIATKTVHEKFVANASFYSFLFYRAPLSVNRRLGGVPKLPFIIATIRHCWDPGLEFTATVNLSAD
ncbi:hypothetical protein CEXT_282551 [Caerostris extrusa]|uniref:Uncharacterized protein n=1 Tax=Caerostris extrusa TaxID=172846 RepID=A0AAV4WGI4_CAEEX|nr:hypothetical protein CEXT_282551 [Caerostris extrusa]